MKEIEKRIFIKVNRYLYGYHWFAHRRPVVDAVLQNSGSKDLFTLHITHEMNNW